MEGELLLFSSDSVFEISSVVSSIPYVLHFDFMVLTGRLVGRLVVTLP